MEQSMTDKRKNIIRRHYRFYGAVQGVGFRYRACYYAEAAGAAGWVRNESDGSVSMELQGTEEQIDMVLQTISQSRYIDIRSMDVRNIPVEDERDFYVKEEWWY